MNILRLPQAAFSKRSKPLIAYIDMQREFVSEGRPSYIAEAGAALANAATLLGLARDNRFPIAHFRLLKRDNEFNRASEYSHWVEAVRPRPNEMVYERSQPSCFSNAAFGELISNIERPFIVVAGMGCELACLASIVDGFHRGCDMAFVKDCSASRALAQWTEAETHDAVSKVASSFGVTVELAHLSTLLVLAERGGLKHL